MKEEEEESERERELKRWSKMILIIKLQAKCRAWVDTCLTRYLRCSITVPFIKIQIKFIKVYDEAPTSECRMLCSLFLPLNTDQNSLFASRIKKFSLVVVDSLFTVVLFREYENVGLCATTKMVRPNFNFVAADRMALVLSLIAVTKLAVSSCSVTRSINRSIWFWFFPLLVFCLWK